MTKAEIIAELRRSAAEDALAYDEGCICHGNWRLIVSEAEHLLNRRFCSHDGIEFTLFGFVHGSDDYYYGMRREGEVRLLSCVGSLEGHGYLLLEDE